MCAQLRTEEVEIVKSYRQRHGGEDALEGLVLHPSQACGWRADCGGEVYWEDPELTSASPTTTEDTSHSPVRGLVSLSESWLHPEGPLMVQIFSAFSSLD